GRNVELCRTATYKFGVPLAIARLRLLEGITSWAKVTASGTTRISWNDLIQAVVSDMTLSPALTRLAKADQREQIIKIKICLPTIVGRTIDELSLEGCEALALNRNGTTVEAFPETVLEMGDVLTLIGMEKPLNKVRESFASL